MGQRRSRPAPRPCPPAVTGPEFLFRQGELIVPEPVWIATGGRLGEARAQIAGFGAREINATEDGARQARKADEATRLGFRYVAVQGDVDELVAANRDVGVTYNHIVVANPQRHGGCAPPVAIGGTPGTAPAEAGAGIRIAVLDTGMPDPAPFDVEPFGEADVEPPVEAVAAGDRRRPARRRPRQHGRGRHPPARAGGRDRRTPRPRHAARRGRRAGRRRSAPRGARRPHRQRVVRRAGRGARRDGRLPRRGRGPARRAGRRRLRRQRGRDPTALHGGVRARPVRGLGPVGRRATGRSRRTATAAIGSTSAPSAPTSRASISATSRSPAPAPRSRLRS